MVRSTLRFHRDRSHIVRHRQYGPSTPMPTAHGRDGYPCRFMMK